MTQNDDIAAIAKGLTKAQREVITGNFKLPFSSRSYGQIRSALVRKRLFMPHVGVSPLGHRVRAYLLENRDEQG